MKQFLKELILAVAPVVAPILLKHALAKKKEKSEDEDE